MRPSCKIEKEFNKSGNKSSKKDTTNYVCNYIDCKYTSLRTIKYFDTSCDNWFHYSCQIEYDIFEYDSEFDTMNGLKKTCKKCVDKIMKIFRLSSSSCK